MDNKADKNIKHEYKLNKQWIYNNSDEVIGEVSFVVPADFVHQIYKEQLTEEYDSFEDFLDCYIPEEEGLYIYEEAVKNNCLIDVSTNWYDSANKDNMTLEKALFEFIGNDELKPGTYNIGFNDHSEAQFDVNNREELYECWIEFCKEEKCSVNCVDYVSEGYCD